MQCGAPATHLAGATRIAHCARRGATVSVCIYRYVYVYVYIGRGSPSECVYRYPGGGHTRCGALQPVQQAQLGLRTAKEGES